MLGALEYLVVPSVGLLIWHETRILGDRRDDRDVIEAAPVVAGLCILVGYMLGGELTTPVTDPALLETVGVWEARRWTAATGVLWGTATTGMLLGLEAVLADQGRLDHEWRVLPEPLRTHAREKITTTEVDA